MSWDCGFCSYFRWHSYQFDWNDFYTFYSLPFFLHWIAIELNINVSAWYQMFYSNFFADITYGRAMRINSYAKKLFSFLSLLVCVLNFHQNWISRIFAIKFKTGFSDSMFQMSSHWILYSTKLQKWNDVMRTHWFYYNVFISKLKKSHISRVSISTWSQSTQW